MAYLLIVDDDEDFASAAAAALECVGHEVGIETDHTNAIANMGRRMPDLLILDVMFPQNPQGGFELAGALHERTDALAKIPILMLTAINATFPFGFNADGIDESWLPVSDFIEKPVDLDALQARVAKSLQENAPKE